MEKIKKIIFYNDSLTIGGSEIVLINILKALNQKKEIKLILESSLSDHTLVKEIPSEIKINYLFSENTEFKLAALRGIKRNLKEKLKYNYFLLKKQREKLSTINKINKQNFDVFIDFKIKLIKHIDRIKAGKKIAWIHFSIKNTFKIEKLKSIGENLKKYDNIIVTSEGSKKEILELYPFLEDKVIRIYNFFDFDKIKRLSEDTKTLSEKDKAMLKEDYCITVARLDTETKDFYTLLKAFHILKEKRNPYKLYIVGDGKNREEIESWIKELKVEDKVYLLGAKTNPYVWIKNSKLLVHSSKTEAFGLVLVEAMILEIPVISSDCPVGPMEILEDGKSGILIPIGDSEKMAEKIIKILDSKELKKEKIKNANLRIKDFDKIKNIDEIKKVIDIK